MRKFLASAIAAVTFGGAVAATAGPAEAQRYYRRDRDKDNDAAAAAIVAGVAGLAIGAALASSNRDRRYDRYSGGYDRPYGYGYVAPRYGYSYAPRYGSSYDRYGYGYGYAPRAGYGYAPYGYRTCTRKERHWDPYYGGQVTVKRRVPC